MELTFYIVGEANDKRRGYLNRDLKKLRESTTQRSGERLFQKVDKANAKSLI